MYVDRYFFNSNKDALASVDWEKRQCKIQDEKGNVVFEAEVEAPVTWSQLAVNVVASKYLRLSFGETSIRSLIRRVVLAITESGKDQGYFDEKQAKIFKNELAYLLVHQILSFNSPVWFNAGVFETFGVKGESENWYWNGVEIVQTKSAYEHPQCSACFIQSVDDSLPSIFELIKNQARLFKFGSGTGTNWSNLRGNGESLSSGGSSSGLMSFLKVADSAAGATKSGGSTRRAASLNCLDMDHPEIEDFITWKSKEEQKAKALIAQGYDPDYRGEAYQTISGQNANNSVQISDAFMKAVEVDGDWNTICRTTGNIHNTYKARYLWRLIAESAWACACPGVQFTDTMNSWHTSPQSGPIKSTNPCGEFTYIDDSACNLASLNLIKFLDNDGNFDISCFKNAINISIIAQDILVDYASYPTKKIAENSHNHRPLGLGFANLGTLLMTLGIPYNSFNGNRLAASIASLMTATAYYVSSRIAQKLGSFEAINETNFFKIIDKHSKFAKKLENFSVSNHAKDMWESVSRETQFRNAQVTLVAPTGTIGFMMDCDTTGIEPELSLVKTKKIVGGGTIQMVNSSIEIALHNLNYTPESIVRIKNHILKTGSIEGSELKEEHLSIFDCAYPSIKNGRHISPMGHLSMCAAVQPHISGAISKTIGMPESATVEDVMKIYQLAHATGIKGITIYRNNSKGSQPLTFGKTEVKKDEVKEEVPKHRLPAERVRLPKKRMGFTQEAKVGGQKLYLRTGEYEDGKLGEIFIDMHKQGAAFRSLMNLFAMAVSIGLQYGVPLDVFVKQFTFTRFEPSGSVTGHKNIKLATSIVDYIFRVLGIEYLNRMDLAQVQDAEPTPECPSCGPSPSIKDRQQHALGAHEEVSYADAPACPDCGHITVRNGTCYKCLNCGSSLGCS